MTRFSESDLTFEFDENWDIFQYDEHSDYRHLPIPTPSGVDFLGHISKKIVFFEVKNFKNRDKRQHLSIFKKISGNPPTIVEIVSKKVFDTKNAIAFLSKKETENLMFWQNWQRKLGDKTNQQLLILWLELEKEWPNIPKKRLQFVRTNISNLLKSALNGKIDQVFVADISKNPFPKSLKVTEI
jgi:hypothetical protein